MHKLKMEEEEKQEMKVQKGNSGRIGNVPILLVNI